MPIMIVFAIAAAALTIPVMVSWMRQSDQTMLGTVAARQLYAVTQAAKGYITAYAGTIEATATSTTPATITVPMLVSTGFLPQGFGAVNPYQQGWVVEVLQPSPGDLQALALSTGGQPIPPRDAPRIGAEAGSAGGTVTSAGTAQGSYDGWTVSLTNYPNPGVGHLAALIDYSNGQLQNDYLYRTAVPGQPQLNTMQTSLGMGGNDINNANNVQANSAQLAGGNPNGMSGSLQIGSNFLYGDSSNMAVRTPGGFYIQNQNGTGAASISQVQNVSASGQITTPSVVQGGYVNSTGDVNAQNALTAGGGFTAQSNGYTTVANTLTAGSRVVLGTAFGSANPGWGCGPNGEIAANANGSGQLMVCQNGVWGTAGGGGGATSTINTGIAGSYSYPTVYTGNTWPGREGVCIDWGFNEGTYLGYIYWDGEWSGNVDRITKGCFGGVIWAQ